MTRKYNGKLNCSIAVDGGSQVPRGLRSQVEHLRLEMEGNGECLQDLKQESEMIKMCLGINPYILYCWGRHDANCAFKEDSHDTKNSRRSVWGTVKPQPQATCHNGHTHTHTHTYWLTHILMECQRGLQWQVGKGKYIIISSSLAVNFCLRYCALHSSC